MGELAEDMLDGLMCSWCGVYFIKPHGHPVVCKSCAKDRTEDYPPVARYKEL